MQEILTDIIVALPAFLLAIILHELAHGYAAHRLGDDTAQRAGRLTMSPVAHLDVVGSLCFILTTVLPPHKSFGWAKPVPVVVTNLRNPRRDDILVSLAGVAANLAQAIVWAVLFRVAVMSAHTTGPGLAVTLARFCLIGVQVNIVLMVFNLLPIPPLDGSHVAVRLLGITDPYAVTRAAPLGFIVLFALISFHGFDALWGAVADPIIRALIGL